MLTRPICCPIVRPLMRGVMEPAYGSLIAQIRALFAAGELGAWYDPSDLSTLYQDSAGTTPVTALGQPVGLMLDKSGRGNHASQLTATARPTLEADANGKRYLQFDGVDDYMDSPTFDSRAMPNSIFVASVLSVVTGTRTISYGSVASPRHVLRVVSGSPETNQSSIFTSTLGPVVAGEPVVLGLETYGATGARLSLNGAREEGDAGTNKWAQIRLGANFSGTDLLLGGIYGYVGIDRGLTTNERALVERFLAGRSGAY